MDLQALDPTRVWNMHRWTCFEHRSESSYERCGGGRKFLSDGMLLGLCNCGH